MSKGFGTPASVPPSATIKKLKRSLIEQFESLADPRVRQPEHLLLDIVAIAILAVIAGADDMVAVETYGKAKAAWLKTFLALPNGIPSHDTFSRVLALELIYKVNLKLSVFFAYQGFQAPEAVLSGFPESLALREFQRLDKSALNRA
jgi:hypothetical protein